MSESPQIGNWTEEQADKAGYDFDAENQAVWATDGLEIEENHDGELVVRGQAITAPIEGPGVDINEGTDVRVWISSYRYGKSGETHSNHVPMYALVAPDGSVITDGSAGDSGNPEKAVERAKASASTYFKNPEQYVED